MLPSARAAKLSAKVRGVRHASGGYLHNSILPTFYYQPGLQRLPIPTLEETLRKYANFLEPVVTPEQFAEAKKGIELFSKEIGPKLHNHLTEWDKAHQETSYISSMWYDMYLENRDPLPLNLNPQLTWREMDVAKRGAAANEQAVRASDIVHAAVRFHLDLESQNLRPDVYIMKPELYNASWFQRVVSLLPPKYGYYAAAGIAKSYALDMSQYPRLFKSTRIPGSTKDSLWTAPGKVRHIVVQRGPRFYTVEVIDAEGKPISPVEIEASLRAILNESGAAGAVGAKTLHTTAVGTNAAAASAAATELKGYATEAPVGALTGLERSAWAAARESLVKASPVNAASLTAIDSALFVLTLDDSSPTDPASLSRSMLHGDGRNRWFDKCINIIVTANGRAGAAWEHAWGDGAAVLYAFNEIYKAICAAPRRDATVAASKVAGTNVGLGLVQSAASNMGQSVSQGPVQLAWDLTSNSAATEAGKAVRAAEAYTDGVIAATDLRVHQMVSFTKEDIKRSKLSPDGVMQMAMQLAHWKAHGYTACSYESASTAAFKHGRTETIRVASPESVELCKLFSQKAGPNDTDAHLQRYHALSKAASRHRKTTLECVMGKGVDRHLYAMAKWAERLDISLDGTLFKTPAHAVFKDIRLSTSTLSSDALEGGGFGPVSRTSYGVGYGVEDRGVHFHIMSYNGSTTNNGDYANACDESLNELQKCIQVAKDKGQIVKDQQ